MSASPTPNGASARMPVRCNHTQMIGNPMMMMRGPIVMKKFVSCEPMVVCAVVGDAKTSHTAGSVITHESAYRRRTSMRSRAKGR